MYPKNLLKFVIQDRTMFKEESISKLLIINIFDLYKRLQKKGNNCGSSIICVIYNHIVFIYVQEKKFFFNNFNVFDNCT